MERFKYKILIPIAIILLCISAAVSMNDSLNTIALYILMPSAFILSILVNGGLMTNKYEKILIYLLLWVAFSWFWAIYKAPATQQMNQILGTFIFTFTIFVCAKRQQNIPWLYVIYILLFLSAWKYAQENIVSQMGERERLDDDKLNANTLAYYLFYLTMSIYILADIIKNRVLRVLFSLLFFMMLPLSYILALLTASRQVLIIQIPLILSLLFIRYFINSKLWHKLLFVVIACTAIYYLSSVISQMYVGSLLQERSEANVSEDERTTLLNEAIEVGIEHFPFGVGANNFVKYSKSHGFSHNNYAELFVNNGIIGVILYLWMMLLFLNRQWKRYRFFRDKQFLVFLLFGIIYFVDGFFYSFYNNLWLMGFFILVATHSETYYNDKYLQYQL